MVKKKSTKKVLDYDPLAWLDEAEQEAEQQDSVANKTTSDKQLKQAQAGKGQDEIEHSAAEENPAYGFFAVPDSDDQPAGESEQEPAGFGFFDDPPTQATEQTAEADELSEVIDLGAELTIRSVASCKSRLDQSFQNGFDIKLQAGSLQKIDSAGIQLIYSLNKTLEKTSQSIQWMGSSPIINQAARLAGLPDLIEMGNVEEDDAAFGFFNDESSVTDNQQEESTFGFF